MTTFFAVCALLFPSVMLVAWLAYAISEFFVLVRRLWRDEGAWEVVATTLIMLAIVACPVGVIGYLVTRGGNQ